MTADDIKKQMDEFTKMEGGLEGMVKGIGNIMTPFMEEQRKLLVPKSKKDVHFHGKTCAMSLISDGRIIIAFSTMDEAERVYNDEIISGAEAKRLVEALISSNIEMEKEKNKTWFQKLLGK